MTALLTPQAYASGSGVTTVPTTNLLLHLDATDTDYMSLLTAASFTDDAYDPQYLSVDDHADFTATTQLTIEFWVNKNRWRTGKGETYVAKAGATGNRSWWVYHGSSFQNEHDLSVKFYDASDTESVATVNSTSSDEYVAEWSHVMIVYNGAAGTNASRCIIYLDGVAQTVSFTGTIPSSLKDSSAPVTIGRADAEAAWRLEGRMSRVRIWNGSLTSSNVTTLYNGGDGKLWGDISAVSAFTSSIAAAWDLTETSGTRYDRSGNLHHLSEPPGATVSSDQLILSWTDKSSNGYVFEPVYGINKAQGAAGYPFFGRAPVYDASAANSLCVDFAATHKMACRSSQPFNTVSGDVLMAFKANSDLSSLGEQFPLMVASESTATQYMGILIEIDEDEVWRLRDDGVGFNSTNPSTSSAISYSTAYLTNWRGLGTGDAASFTHRRNLVDQSLTVNIQNRWFSDVTDRDVIGLGTLARSDGVQGTFDWNCGSIVVYGTTVSTKANRAAELALKNRHGF